MVDRALGCIGLLDNASFNTPPRLLAAPATSVTNHTSESGARQLIAKKRQPGQRGGVHQFAGTRTRCITLRLTGAAQGSGITI